MSGADEVVCEGWLRKSPPEKKLRRYAWKRRWFVLRSGRLSGEPDVLQYYKSPTARRPLRTILLHLCDQVDAGLTFNKKELESSFVFDLRTAERTWYLVAECEEDMNRWVSCICLLCGFNPTDQLADRAAVTAMSPNAGIAMVTGSVPPPYEVAGAPYSTHDGSTEEEYMWLSHCQSHIRPPLGSSATLESSSSCPSLRPLSPFQDPRLASPADSRNVSPADPRRRAGRPRCHPSPHPRKHSLDFHLRPVAIPLGDTMVPGGYQIPRPVRTTTTTTTIAAPQPTRLAPRRPSSTPSLDSLLTGAELRASTPTPPPRPPKTSPTPPPAVGSGGRVCACVCAEGSVCACLEAGPEGSGGGGGGMPRSNAVAVPGSTPTSCESFYIPRSLSDRASMFEFSESFNSYFLNKGMVPLGSVCSEDDDVDENYVPMSAATTEPPVAPRVHSASSVLLQDANYVFMTTLAPAPLGRKRVSLTPNSAEGATLPPPVHRNLKPQRAVKPLDIAPLDWQEVPPPVRSPVTRTFTRDPSSPRSVQPSAHSSSPSSDSSDPDDSYVAMTTSSSRSFSTGESSLRPMIHRTSEGIRAGSPLPRRPRGNKQVEYLDLDLYSVQRTPTRQKHRTAEGRSGSVEERARSGRVDYVVVDPKRTMALRNTREAWHDGRMSTEKDKC